MRNWIPAHAMSAARAAAIRAEFGALPPATSPSWRVRNADSARPKFYVFDVIGGWDTDAQEFVQAVHAVEADALDLHINSPGGFVFDAVSMFEALQQSPAQVHVHIDGLAASAASFLAQVGNTVEIAKGGRMMVHDAQMVAIGSPADLREAADLGDQVSNDIAGYYADRAGGSVASWRSAMQATTWYSSAEAVDAKLADRITGPASTTEAGASNRSRLAKARAAVTLGGVR